MSRAAASHKDDERALRWAESRRRQENLRAIHRDLLLPGARAWANTPGRALYRRAAEGYPAAQNNLGMLYVRGEGVPQDHRARVGWFAKAAKQGLPDAAYNLALLYSMARASRAEPSTRGGALQAGRASRPIGAANWLLKNGYTAWVENLKQAPRERDSPAHAASARRGNARPAPCSAGARSPCRVDHACSV